MDNELFEVVSHHALAVWEYLDVAGSFALETPAWEHPDTVITWGALRSAAIQEWIVLAALFELPIHLEVPGSDVATTTLLRATYTFDAWIGPTTCPLPRRAGPDLPERILSYWSAVHLCGYVEFDDSRRMHYALPRSGP